MMSPGVTVTQSSRAPVTRTGTWDAVTRQRPMAWAGGTHRATIGRTIPDRYATSPRPPPPTPPPPARGPHAAGRRGVNRRQLRAVASARPRMGFALDGVGWADESVTRPF